MSPRFRLVVFDLDGTLIDTMGSFADLAGRLIRDSFGWPFEVGRRRYLDTSGVPFFQQMETLFPGDERNAGVVELFEKGKISAFMAESITDSTRETLHSLRDKAIRTAISSNNFHELVREFVHFENIPIDVALGFRENFSKGRDHFEYLSTYFHIPFSEMVFVGDSLMDATKAQDAGVFFVARIGTFSRDDFQPVVNQQPLVAINDISEIVNVLEI